MDAIVSDSKPTLRVYTGEITNKMQPCNSIYYSTVHWRLNMFWAAYRSSSGVLTVFAASGLHMHVVTGRSQVWLDYGRLPHAYVNQRLQIQLQLLMLSGMPLETCWAFNERWNNKYYYKVASCWLFPLSHITMHGSMNFIQRKVYIQFVPKVWPHVLWDGNACSHHLTVMLHWTLIWHAVLPGSFAWDFCLFSIK
jgi:hypothetical protein